MTRLCKAPLDSSYALLDRPSAPEVAEMVSHCGALPFDILPNDDLVLLTVHLSSLGQVSVHRSTSVKNVDAGSNRRTGKKNIPVLLFSEDIYAP